jgi:hypothetical protein
MEDFQTRPTADIQELLCWGDGGLYICEVSTLDLSEAGRQQKVSLHVDDQ